MNKQDLEGVNIRVTGIVQGVGFRPFIYGLAHEFGLTGWVRNTSAGVEIEVDGSSLLIKRFVNSLSNDAPPLALIDHIEVTHHDPNHFTKFEILLSESIPGVFQPISPDICVCNDCLRELFDPSDRRFRYPFINCTNCGPRFTIVKDIPYDRPNTTMASFEMCSDCLSEYNDPRDRRFHAQPIACSVCGPSVWLEPSPNSDLFPFTESLSGDNAIKETQRLLALGKILAIKGIGGFHLACDATNSRAVSTLRERKLRVDKPFAVMMADLATIQKHCQVNSQEELLLDSRERPILILNRQTVSMIGQEVAPNQATVGVMLPYSPLHYLLLENNPEIPKFTPILVMTSGNMSEEPIATDNEDARSRLSAIADAFLFHNRPIHIRCDDSVMHLSPMAKTIPDTPSAYKSSVNPLRRARGYTPYPIHLSWKMPPLLATGADLKNTFCLAKDSYAFLSHHIGDMENYETYKSFLNGILHFERLFHIKPEAIAYDLHPNYLSSQYARERATRDNLQSIAIQHHHAHIAACMAEKGIESTKKVIGIAFDGTGYGEDGAIWGGEILLAGYDSFIRKYHLSYVPLPGGDISIRKPARTALAYLWQSKIEWNPAFKPVAFLDDQERDILKSQLEKKVNTPLTSSMGRLFDAVAALMDIRQEINYEAQAAIEMEALADPSEQAYYSFNIEANKTFKSDNTNQPIAIDTSPIIHSILNDLKNQTSLPKISARFHNSIAHLVLQACSEIRSDTSINEVVLSGGVWQNRFLFEKTVQLLGKNKFTLYTHNIIPSNDGGISLGQAVICHHRLKK